MGMVEDDGVVLLTRIRLINGVRKIIGGDLAAAVII